MTTLRQAAEQALHKLEKLRVTIDSEWGECRTLEEIDADGVQWSEVLALRSALEQPQAEQATDGGPNLLNPAVRDELAISWGYVKPQPPRQPLTEEEIAYCIFEARLGAEGAFKRNGSSSYRIARAIEARILGEQI